jgi:hypothetical protein
VSSPGRDIRSHFDGLASLLVSPGPPLPHLAEMTVGDLFEIRRGHSIFLCDTTEDASGIPYIGASSRNNGATGRVAAVPDQTPYPAGSITVAVDGSILEAFVQDEPFYAAPTVHSLLPKFAMRLEEKLFLVAAIRMHKFRFNYGRKAHRDLPTLRIPLPGGGEIPTVGDVAQRLLVQTDWESISARLTSKGPALPETEFMTLGDLFTTRRGHDLDLCHLTETPDGLAYVSCTARSNGVSGRVERLPETTPGTPGEMTLALVGATLMTFVQTEEFYTAQNVEILTPRYAMSLEQKLYFATAIRQHQFRFNYGRKANRTFKTLRLPLPSRDWRLPTLEGTVATLLSCRSA